MIYLSWDGVSLACAGFELVLSLGMTLTSCFSRPFLPGAGITGVCCYHIRLKMVFKMLACSVLSSVSYDWKYYTNTVFPVILAESFTVCCGRDLTAWGRPSKHPAKTTHCTFFILKNHWAMWINNVWIFSIIAKLMYKNLSLSPCQNQSASQRTQSKIK